MPRFNWDGASDQSFTPLSNGLWEVVCIECEKRLTQSSGRLMYSAKFITTETNPDQGANRMIFENYVVGPVDDANPDFIEIENNVGLSRMVAAASAMNIPPIEELDELAAEFVGKKFVARTMLKPTNRGMNQPNITATFPVGTQKLGPFTASVPNAGSASEPAESSVRRTYTPPDAS